MLSPQKAIHLHNIPIGERFNRLVVIAEAEKRVQPNGKRKTRVLCLCDCGNQKIFHLSNLKRNKSISCGCFRNEQTLKKNTKHGHSFKFKTTKEYRAWVAIKDRCTNENCPKYEYYGGRGITVCEKWLHSFESFLEDVGPSPGVYFSIDRLDNNGNYTPDNVRWDDKEQQNNNRRSTVLITYEGQTKSVTQWSKHFNVSMSSLRTKLFVLKMPMAEALLDHRKLSSKTSREL